MDTSLALSALIGVAVVALLLYRQLVARKVKTDGSGRMMLILGVIGIVQLAEFVESSGSIGVFGVGMLVVSFALAAALSTIRALSVRIWRAGDGSWWRRGTTGTLVLWLVSIGSHFGIDVLAAKLAGPAVDIQGLGNATLLLYLALSLGLQNMLVARRVANQVGTGSARFPSSAQR